MEMMRWVHSQGALPISIRYEVSAFLHACGHRAHHILRVFSCHLQLQLVLRKSYII
jgi:hypothetical protein